MATAKLIILINSSLSTDDIFYVAITFYSMIYMRLKYFLYILITG